MRESRPDKESMVLCVRHKGFIRMALRTGKKLVPILSFGEDQILRNVYVPGVQAYTLARIGVALPVYIMGRWFSPIPNKVDVTMVIGEPISVPLDPDPSTELINTLHEQYYSQIRHMFDAHKERAGFPDCQLTFMTH
jgi:1-acyl-sn-glycerol-3-phosphate acyltransferase